MLNILTGVWIVFCILYVVLTILDKRVQKKFAREKNIEEGLEKCLRLVKEIRSTPWTEIDILTRPRPARKKLMLRMDPTMKDIADTGGGVRIQGDDVTFLTPEEVKDVGNHFDLRVMDDKIGTSQVDEIKGDYLKHVEGDVMKDVKWENKGFLHLDGEVYEIEDIEEIDDA